MDSNFFQSEQEYIAQMYTGALLNPRLDSTFKALFTQPTAESRGALKSFLEAATERKIDSFEFVSNAAPEAFGGQRQVNYDIACIFADGEAADIEMQAFNQKYDYGKRAEYQVARLETTYLKKGDTWEKAPSVYQITVLDFIYTPIEEADSETKKSVSRYSMRTKSGKELSNALNIVFIELPKVAGLEKSVETNTLLENWALFLKEVDNPQKNDVIQKLTKQEEGIMQAQQSLSNISENQALWIEQYRMEMAERDYRSGLSAAMNEGIEKGMEQGIARGRIEAARESARNALQLGLSREQVAKITGLAMSEIEKL